MPWLGRRRFFVLAAICVFWTGAILLARKFPDAPLLSAIWSGEQNFEDLLQRAGRKTATRDDFVFLGIDQSTLEFKPFEAAQIAQSRALQLLAQRKDPLPREVWALLLDRLFSAGARLVIFDLVFSGPTADDEILRATLDRYHAQVVLGANLDLARNAQAIWPNEQLISPPASADPRVGTIVFFGDALDRKVRALRGTISDRQLAGLPPQPGQEIFESLSARALEQLGEASKVPRDLQPHLLRFSANDAYQPTPLWEIFDDEIWRANFASGTAFKNKIVIVGAASQVKHDFVATPMNPQTPGPALHLQAIAAASAGEYLTTSSFAAGNCLVAAAGLAALALVAFLRRPLVSGALLLASVAIYFGIARLLYDRAGLLLLAVPPVAAFLLSGSSGLGFDFALERLERLRTRRTLERYVSKNLVAEILDHPESFYSSLRGVRMPATILFSDIVGFTALSENGDPERLVRQLNEYLARMTAAVFAHGGTLDKFIGDAVMAVWGNVHSRGKIEDAKSCARAALAMRRELQTLNEKWRAEGIAPFAIGLGINSGEVLGGNIGSQEKADPTVIGDAVNLASRLEGLTRIYGVDLLLGESAAELLRAEFFLRSVARVQVKGKARPVEIFTLVETAEEFARLRDYEAALEKFRARDFCGARNLFEKFLTAAPGDSLGQMYFERARAYETAPPPLDWSGVEVFTKK